MYFDTIYRVQNDELNVQAERNRIARSRARAQRRARQAEREHRRAVRSGAWCEHAASRQSTTMTGRIA